MVTSIIHCVILLSLATAVLGFRSAPFRFLAKSYKQQWSSFEVSGGELLPDDFFDTNSEAIAAASASTSTSDSNKDSDVQPKSELQTYFELIMTKLGKCDKSTLRAVISKYHVDSLPDANDDLETHITTALSVLWQEQNGDWNAFLDIASKELDHHVANADRWLREAVFSGSSLTESRLKELIKINANANAMPKLDKKKYKGKFVSTDYLACLIDILREKFDGNFEKVAEVLHAESSLTKKKGFGFASSRVPPPTAA